MKIAIIGTGMSGLSLANILKEKHNVVLFEKQQRVGGLIKCETVDSVLFHRVGGHVFNTRNKKVSDWFWSYFDKDTEFYQVKRNAKIYIRNKIIGYPIENYLYEFDEDTVKDIVSELLSIKDGVKIAPLLYANFEEFLKSTFGESLYNIYFKPYNHKIWRTDLSTVPMPWLEGKLPMPDLKEILVSNIVRKEESQMVHSSFYYPKVNGSQYLVDRLSKGLDIRVDAEVIDARKNGGKYEIGGETGFDKIIHCGDIRCLPNYMDDILSQKIDIQPLKKLRSNGTSNVLCETDPNDISWLYIPEEFTKAHRIIYTGNFSPANNGASRRKTCVVEFSGQVVYEEILNELPKLPGNLKPISYNYEPNSYVIHDSHTKDLIDNVKSILKEENIFLLGRFAEWEYYNMDKCVEAAMKLSEIL